VIRNPLQRLAKPVLFTPEELRPGRTILVRVGLLLGVLLVVFLVLLADRNGLRDHADGYVSVLDVLYFTMVTITTVGYGDIVPVTPEARLIDSLFLTPARFFIWFIFLGTAYQLAVRRYVEEYRMATLQSQLNNHVIVCGLGHTGLSAVKELLAKGSDPKQILVVEPSEERARMAVDEGLVAIRGNATQEAVLKDAVIDKARAVIVSAGRDDTNALILLTARHLNPSIRIIVSAKEEENVKLFRQGGATTIVSPASFGGYLVAAAVEQSHYVEYFEDLLTSGGRVNLVERIVGQEDVGKSAAELHPEVLLRVYREGKIISLWEFRDGGRLVENDAILLLTPVKQKA
jgi:voltage-gated potassium channel